MNSPTMLSMPAISGGRPATVTPNTTSSRPVMRPEQNGPGGLQHGVERHALPARLLGQRRGQRLVQRQRDLLRRDRRARAVAAAPHGSASSSPAKASRQAAIAAVAILRREPGQIVAIGRDPRQRRGVALAAHKASAAPAPAQAPTSHPSAGDGW